MRRPTPLAEVFAWHRDAIAGRNPPIHDAPQAGWFKRRLSKGGVYVAARIWLDQPTDESGELIGQEEMRCEVNGERRDPQQEWLWLANYPISEAEYRYMIADAKWARANAPDDPHADPTQAVDHLKTPTPF